MSPSFLHNDYLIIAPPLLRSYRPKDVVVLKHQELGLIVKRVVQVKAEQLELKGDNPNSSHIGWQPKAYALGRVLFHFKGRD